MLKLHSIVDIEPSLNLPHDTEGSMNDRVKSGIFQVYTYSIPGVFAQGAKHPLLDYLSFVS